MLKHFAAGEIAIEIGGSTNNWYLFKPLGAVLRGKWSVRNIPGGGSSHRMPRLNAAPDTPGIIVALDQSKKTLRTVDPLGFPENERVLAEVNETWGKYHGKQRPSEPTLTKHLGEGHVKSALWEMSEMVRAGSATVVNGVIPSPEKIMAMPGYVKARMFYSNPEAREHVLDATEKEEQRILASAMRD